MKVQALDNFTSKLALIADTSLKQKLLSVVTSLETSSILDSFLSSCQYNDGVYSFQIDSYTLYFSIINEELYFVDIIEPIQVFKGINRKNPRLNSIINPKINSRINPNINSRINPRINSRLNPNINSRLNPKINSRINPKINSNMDCMYIYDVATVQCLYYSIVVPNSDNVIMVYDYQYVSPSFYGIKRDTGYCIFNIENNEYVGFWESNGSDGYNWFDNNLCWTRFVV